MKNLISQPVGATPIAPNEIKGLRYRHITTLGELNELEQANVASGLRWLGRLRRGVDVLTEGFICELHNRLFGDVWKWAGTFRLTEKNIGCHPSQIAMQLRDLLDDARYWHQHGTYESLEAGARLHHRMVQIHPFPNGNGRHTRLAADTYLKRYFGAPPIDWDAGHNLRDRKGERRREYLTALCAADHHDIAPLLKFVGARR
jgi:Fic-DOC domain mobile mystery protein B